jgi:LmbE family N-acetylglucosaminyl deacetylase
MNAMKRITPKRVFNYVMRKWLRTRRDVTEKELFQLAENSPVIFLSPHLDDAVLSCGGLLAKLAKKHLNVEVITVFTADAEGRALSPLAQRFHEKWGNHTHPFRIRREEDKACAEYLGIRYRWLGFQDVIYRDPNLENDEIITSPDYDVYQDPCLKSVTKEIRSILEETPSSLLFVPLSLGHHRDHKLVYEAIKQLRNENSVVQAYYYYEDYPYAKWSDLSLHLSKLALNAEPTFINIADHLSDKVHLISLHASQISELFADPRKLHEEIKAYAELAGTRDRPLERYWRVKT